MSGLRVEFPAATGSIAATVLTRSATELEIIIPAGAVSGNVLLTLDGVTRAQVPFTAAPAPALTRVRTLAARLDELVSGWKGPGLALANDTTLFFADTAMHQVYEIRTGGTRTLYAGAGDAGGTDGPRLSARFTNPNGLVYDQARQLLYVADTGNHRIRKITADGTVSTLAGFQGGDVDGSGTAAKFRDPKGLALDDAGNVYVADEGNNKIRRVTPDGVVTTFAGSSIGWADGTGSAAKFNAPRGVTFHGGVLYVADTGNRAIRKITPDVSVSTIVRTTNSTPAPRLEEPAGIVLDGYGTVFVTDSTTHQVFRVTLDGQLSVFAGSGTEGFTEGTLTAANLKEPAGIVYAGQLYVQDYRNRAVRSIESDPAVRDVHPRSGPASGGTTVRVFGHSFVAGTTVRFGGTLATNVTILSPTELTAVTPAGVGAADVTVTTPYGTSTLAGVFTYLTPPAITGISPTSGRIGSSVTMTGSHFDASAQVFFGSAEAGISSQTSTEIIVTVPAGANSGPITVTTTAGSAQSATFTVVVLSSVSVTPGSVSLTAGGSAGLTAIATYSDGSTADVTATASWQSSAGAIAAVSASGVVTALAEGTATIAATYGGFSGSSNVTVTAPPPAGPNAPPPLDPTVPTDVGTATRFLYEGTDPVQQGVPAGTIEEKRAAVIKGIVRGRDDSPLADVRVTIVGHPEYGWTLTRADGAYDLVVNGGGKVTVGFTKDTYLPVHRAADVPWQDYVVMDPLVLTALDPAVTVMTANAPSIQIARGSMSTDASGVRRATILVPAGTQPTLTFADGTEQPISSLTFRATEYTAGTSGVTAMPAALPPASGYTYCVELSVDEALTAGATGVQFSQPVPFYLENFLGFPVGSRVPVGTYDRATASWIPEENGRVIRITAIDGTLASVDTDGDGTADNAGLTTDERAALATLYPAGTSLWRAALHHFSPIDLNWPVITPAGATYPGQPPPRCNRADQSCPMPGSTLDGSIIDCWNQTLGEQIPVTGTPFTLAYSSGRVPGRIAGRTIEISLSGATIPAPLKRIDLLVSIAGTAMTTSFAPGPNLKHAITWDGKDAYGRTVSDGATARVGISYIYDAVYAIPPDVGRSFGIGSAQTTTIPARVEQAFRQTFEVALEAWDARSIGLGGWTLSGHQRYDFNNNVLLGGDGSHVIGGTTRGRVLVTVAGNSTGPWPPPDSTTNRSPISPRDIATAPSGDIYLAEGAIIRRLRGDVLERIAGNGLAGSGGDGGPALDASFDAYRIALAPNDTIYIWDGTARNIRRIRDGVITTVAGNGGFYQFDGALQNDNVPATEVATQPDAMDVGPDGLLYVIERDGWLRRIGTTGRFERVARFPEDTFYALAIARDGSAFIGTNGHIRRADLGGTITQVAGRGVQECGALGWPVQDGVPANEACFYEVRDLDFDDEGNLYFADERFRSIRVISSAGLIRFVAGNGTSQGATSDGNMYLEQPLAIATFVNPWILAVAPDASVYFTDRSFLRRATPALPSFDPDAVLIGSGPHVYVFESFRHTRTLDALTGVTLYQYGYNPNGYLISVTDLNGRVTQIQRDASNQPTAIVSPGGRQTKLTLNAGGYLERIEHPDTTAHQFTYSTGGLLASLTTPRNDRYDFQYDPQGLLVRDTDPATGFKQLDRTGNATGFTLTTTTAEGRSLQHTLARGNDGSRDTRIRDTAGLETRALTLLSEHKTLTSTDGMRITTQPGPDPRWGIGVPVTASATVSTPAGRTMSIAQTRTATLSDQYNLLSLTQQTDTATVNGKTWTMTYTAADRKLRTTTPLGRAVDRFLDAEGRVNQISVPGMLPVTITYDTLGRLQTMTQGTRTTTFAWNTRDELQSVTDALARAVSFTYDDAGRVKTQTLPGNRLISFGYDSNGNLTSLTPPGRAAHTMAHTPVDNLAGYTPPGTDGMLQYTYNRDRQLTSITRSDGRTITYAYHPTTARLGSIGDGTTTFGLTYDEAGRVKTVSSPGASLEYWYDGSLLTGVVWSGPINAWIDFEYDNDLRLTRELVNDVPVAFGYDNDGVLTAAGALTITPDPANGRPTGTTVANVAETITYEATGERKQSTIVVSGLERLTLATSTRDALGRATTESETFNGVTNTTSYGYDLEGRLQTVHRNGTLAATYGYDANGNRTSLIRNGQTTTATYDANQDRLQTYGSESYTYTPNGELRTKTNGTGTTTYTYDSFGNLRTIALPDSRTIEYVIDGQNRRVGKKIDGVFQQGWLYSDQLRIAAELDGTGQVVSRFIYGTRSNVPDLMIRSGITYRILSDQRGSPVLVVDTSSGETIQYRSYDEFGNITADTNPALHPFGFAGGLYDGDIGLTRFGARDYDAHVGRFVSKDPILFAGGDTNLYAYGLNDSVNMIDPTGTSWIESVATAAKMTFQWATGTGPTQRAFGPGSNQVNDMKDAYRVNQARDFFRQKNVGRNCGNLVGVSNFDGQFGLMGLLRAGLDPTEQFVGSYRVDIAANPNGTATYTLSNTSSLKSLLYGIAPAYSRSTFGPGGNMSQTYQWTENSCGCP